jgi:hypothetical protein
MGHDAEGRSLSMRYYVEMKTSKGWVRLDDIPILGLNDAINFFRTCVLSRDYYDYRLTALSND